MRGLGILVLGLIVLFSTLGSPALAVGTSALVLAQATADSMNFEVEGLHRVIIVTVDINHRGLDMDIKGELKFGGSNWDTCNGAVLVKEDERGECLTDVSSSMCRSIEGSWKAVTTASIPSGGNEPLWGPSDCEDSDTIMCECT